LTHTTTHSAPESAPAHADESLRFRTVTTGNDTVVQIASAASHHTPVLATVPVAETDLDQLLA
jgi:hypothetical protein